MMTTTLDIKHFNIFHFNLTTTMTLPLTIIHFNFKLDIIVFGKKIVEHCNLQHCIWKKTVEHCNLQHCIWKKTVEHCNLQH
jgi:hypothetical protein